VSGSTYQPRVISTRGARFELITRAPVPFFTADADEARIRYIRARTVLVHSEGYLFFQIKGPARRRQSAAAQRSHSENLRMRTSSASIRTMRVPSVAAASLLGDLRLGRAVRRLQRGPRLRLQRFPDVQNQALLIKINRRFGF
jgi:hypothetical protein